MNGWKADVVVTVLQNDTHDLVAHDKEGTTEEDACPEVMLC